MSNVEWLEWKIAEMIKCNEEREALGMRPIFELNVPCDRVAAILEELRNAEGLR
jgi:hypothetical protein